MVTVSSGFWAGVRPRVGLFQGCQGAAVQRNVVQQRRWEMAQLLGRGGWCPCDDDNLCLTCGETATPHPLEEGSQTL